MSSAPGDGLPRSDQPARRAGYRLLSRVGEKATCRSMSRAASKQSAAGAANIVTISKRIRARVQERLRPVDMPLLQLQPHLTQMAP